jgi:predicted transcriptional regulator
VSYDESMIEMTHSVTWDGVLSILRDPIFALVFAVFLAFLGSRPIRRLVRTVFWLASIIILIWLAAHNASSAHVEIAVVTDVTRVLLILIAVLFIVALIALAVLLIMYLKSAPVSSPSLREGSALRARRSFIGHEIASLSASEPLESSLGEAADDDVAERLILEEGSRFSNHLDRMIRLLDDLFSSVDYDNPVRACAEVMRIYLSGLSVRSAEIRKIHEECNMGIARISSVLARESYTIRLPLRDMSNKDWFPTSGDWAVVTEDTDLRLPYLALRVICLKADWRAAAMVMYKSYTCLVLLAQIDEF